MKLYINPQSPNSRLATLVANHVNSPTEIEVVDLQSGAHRQPDFLSINPNGKVPALEDGELKLWESNAIACYLASKAESDIWPKSNDRYDIMRWQHWQSSHWAPAIARFIGERIFKTEEDPSVIEEATRNFDRWAQVLNNQLEDNKFVCGDNLTIADFSIVAPLMYKDAVKLPMEGYENVNRWFSEIQELPAWKATAN